MVMKRGGSWYPVPARQSRDSDRPEAGNEFVCDVAFDTCDDACF